MSRGSSQRSEDEFPFWDEPDGRRRRGKKHSDKHHKAHDGERARRPRHDDDEWDDDYARSEWDSMDLDDDLELADELDDVEWDGGGWEEGEDDDEGEDDWRSHDDR